MTMREEAPEKPAVEMFDSLGKRIAAHPALCRGTVAFRLSGPDGGDFFVSNGRVLAEPDSDRPPTIEIIGDARRIQAILGGKKEPRKQFLAGGIRVRGDLRFLSDLMLELGLLKEPL